MKHDNDNRKQTTLPASTPIRGLCRVQASEYVGVSPAFFDQMIRDKLMPRPKKVGGRRIWDRLSLDKYFASLPGGEDEEAKTDQWDIAV